MDKNVVESRLLLPNMSGPSDSPHEPTMVSESRFDKGSTV